jgi:hypothetical protein
MMTVGILYEDLPVKINSDDVEALGINLNDLLEGETKNKITRFLDSVHSIIYDYVIYNWGHETIQNRKIENDLATAKTVKKALLWQAVYLSENNDLLSFIGITKKADGDASLAVDEIYSKVVAPMSLQILQSSILGLNV